MSIQLSDNIIVGQQIPLDSKYFNGTVPYINKKDVIDNVAIGLRYKGLTVAIADGNGVKEYWFKDDINVEADLVEKNATGQTLAMGNVNTTSDSKAATISGNSLQLSPADGSNPGILTTAAQTIAGLKSFKGSIQSDTPTLGVELVATGWNSAGWTGNFDSGWVHAAGPVLPLTNSFLPTAGEYYYISFTVTRTAGSFQLTFGGETYRSVDYTSQIDHYKSNTFTPKVTDSTAGLVITPTNNFAGTIIISVKQIITPSIPSTKLLDSSETIITEIRNNYSDNLFIGNNTGKYNIFSTNTDSVSGKYNTGVGPGTLAANSSGYNNTALGSYALYKNTTGYNNIAIGTSALQNNITGTYNISVGPFANFSNTSGQLNSAIGSRALYSNTTGNNNTAVGYNSGNGIVTGSDNTVIGRSAFRRGTGSYNTILGSSTGFDIISGDSNIFIGYNTGTSFTTGNKNTIIGSNIISTTFPSGTNNWILLADGDGNVRFKDDGTSTILPRLATGGIVKMVTVNSDGVLSTQAITGGGGTVTSVAAGTGMSFTTFTTSGSVAIDITKVPYYVTTPANGLLRYTSGTWSTDATAYLTSAIVSLGGLTGTTQSFVSDTNVQMVSSGTSHTLTWNGKLADDRITSANNWNTAYNNRITSLTTTGSGVATLVNNVLNIPTPQSALFTSLTVTGNNGSSTLTSGVLNVPTYTLSGLGGQTQLNGTGFVKASGTTISYDSTEYTPTARNITINGTKQDLSTDRTWNISTTVPVATSVVLGGVKIGSGVNVTTDGIISVSTAYQAPLLGSGIVKSASGAISYISGTSSQFVKGDGSLDSNAYITASGITADDGVTKSTGSNIKLGGTLTSARTITTNATNTLTIAGLVVNETPTYVVSIGESNQLTKTDITDIVTTATGSNGLSGTNDIKLGGVLTEASTTITNNDNNHLLTLLNNGAIATSANKFNVGTLAKVRFVTGGDTNANTNFAGLVSKYSFELEAPKNPTTQLFDPTSYHAGLISNMDYIGSSANNTIGNANVDILDYNSALTSLTTSSNFTGFGTINRLIGIRVTSPIKDIDFRGTLTQAAGIYIDSQDTIAFPISKTYGIVQAGSPDTNIFEGPTYINNSLNVVDSNVLYSTTASGVKVAEYDFNQNYITSVLRDSPDTIDGAGSLSNFTITKPSSELFTTNYTSSAYKAYERYKAANTWLPTDVQSFQIFENTVLTNTTGSQLAHYYDERVGDHLWIQTYNNKYTLTKGDNKVYILKSKKQYSTDSFANIPLIPNYSLIAGTAGEEGWVFKVAGTGTYTATTWTNGSVIANYYDQTEIYTGRNLLDNGNRYKLVSKLGGDNFGNGIGTTLQGSSNQTGWAFTSNGVSPAVWTSGSIVQGVYPYVSPSDKYASVIATEGTVDGRPDQGLVEVNGKSMNVNTQIDQRGSRRGIRVAQYYGTAGRPSDAQQGELFYNTQDNRFEYYTGTDWRIISYT